MDQNQIKQQQDQHSRQKRKRFFILFLIILFTLIICAIISIFTILKHRTESQSLSANPIEAIQSVCHVTHHYYPCVTSISSLLNHNHTIHASDIIRLAIDATIRELYAIDTLAEELASKIENKNMRAMLMVCHNIFNDSINQLNRSLIMADQGRHDHGPGQEIYEDMVTNLRNLMAQGMNNVHRCLDGLDAITRLPVRQIVKIKKLKMRNLEADIYMSNCLSILDNINVVDEMFDPSIGSILARENYMLTIALFCSQYLVLVFLFCSLLRVFI